MEWIKDGSAYTSDNSRFTIVNEQRSVDTKKKWTLFDIADVNTKGNPREYYTVTLKEAKEKAEEIEQANPVNSNSEAWETIGQVISLPKALTGSNTKAYLSVNALLKGNELNEIDAFVYAFIEDYNSPQYLVYSITKEELLEMNTPIPPLDDLKSFRMRIVNIALSDSECIGLIRHIMQHIDNGEL